MPVRRGSSRSRSHSLSAHETESTDPSALPVTTTAVVPALCACLRKSRPNDASIDRSCRNWRGPPSPGRTYLPGRPHTPYDYPPPPTRVNQPDRPSPEGGQSIRRGRDGLTPGRRAKRWSLTALPVTRRGRASAARQPCPAQPHTASSGQRNRNVMSVLHCGDGIGVEAPATTTNNVIAAKNGADARRPSHSSASAGVRYSAATARWVTR